MSFPSKTQQIVAVSRFLDSEFTEGKDLMTVAKAIVDGYHEALTEGLRKPATPLRTGMLFKMPVDNKVRRVQWIGDDRVWVSSETDAYGWFGSLHDPVWGSCEEFQPKSYREVDGKRKLVEMSEEEITVAWSNPKWSVGDRLSLGQRSETFEVIATSPGGVLMSNVRTGVLTADSSANLGRHYRREGGEITW